MRHPFRFAAILAVTVPALAGATAQRASSTQHTASRTGVSHPQDMPVATSADGISQPILYDGDASTPGYIPTPPVLKARVIQQSAASPVAQSGVQSGVQTVARTYAPGQEITTTSSAYVPYTQPGTAVVVVEPRTEINVIPATTQATMSEAETKLSSGTDPDENVVVRVPGPSNQLPVGTILRVTIKEGLSTHSSTPGQLFHGTLTEDVVRDGKVLLPAGSQLDGRVTDVHGGRRITGTASIRLVTTHITLPDGISYAMRAQVIDTALYRTMRIDHEGAIVHRGHPKEAMAVIGLATGSGAAAGGLLAGVPGALIGAGVGAGVSTAVWLKQDRQEEVPVGTSLTFALSSPLIVGSEMALNAHGTE